MVGIVIVLVMQQAQTYSVVSRLSVINGRNRLMWMLGRNLGFTYSVDGINGSENFSVSITNQYNHGGYEDADGVAALMTVSLIIHGLFVRTSTLTAVYAS